MDRRLGTGRSDETTSLHKAPVHVACLHAKIVGGFMMTTPGSKPRKKPAVKLRNLMLITTRSKAWKKLSPKLRDLKVLTTMSQPCR